MADTASPLATTPTKVNSNGAPASVKLDESLLLYDPLEEQLVTVPQEAVAPFLAEANKMQALCKSLADAKDALLMAEDRLEKTQGSSFPTQAAINQAQQAVDAAQKAYDTAYGAVKSELGDKGYLAGSGNGKDLRELIPLARRPPGQKSKHWATKLTHVRWDKILPKVRLDKINAADKSQAKSFVKNGRIDPHVLRKQLAAVSPKLKAEYPFLYEAGYLSPNLQAWAEQLNVTANDKDPVQFGAGVQLFRYFAGCGASGEWKPSEGKIAGTVSGKAEIMLARGEAALAAYYPGPDGWVWSLTSPTTGKEHLIGAMLLKGEIKLEAAAGASIAAELSLEVSYEGSHAKTKGAPRPSKKRKGGPRKAKLEEPVAQANAGAEAFAGVKASCGLEGSLQFRNPEKDSKFKAIAAIGPKGEVQAGAGAAANLSIDYVNGKFKIYAKLALCVGVGAKGEIGLEVDALQLADFLQYLFHALMNVSFEVLPIITARGFDALTQLHVMLAAGVKDAYQNVNRVWGEFLRQLAREERRVDLMNRVLQNPESLRFAPPEAHGILLHELTRHGDLTYAYPSNSGWSGEVLGRRKDAVLTICRWAQCKRQFENIVQHIGPNGAKGGFKGNLAGLMRFMEIGPLNSSYDDELQRIYDRLPVEPPRGYPLAPNHTSAFMAQAAMGSSPTYLALMQDSSGSDSGTQIA